MTAKRGGKLADSIIATISMAYGVVADISTPAERGAFVGAVLCG